MYGPEMCGRGNKRRNRAKESALGSLQLRSTERETENTRRREGERERERERKGGN